ncbi:hypothetical protein M378DRAFT_37021, partial [Amanita muscaria Koide BX008]
MLVRLPEMPNVVVDFHSLPSNAAILLSLFFALFLLLVVHAAYSLIREYIIIRTKQQLDQKKGRSSLVAQEQGASLPPSSLKALELSTTSPTKVERVRVSASALEKQQARTPPGAPGKGNWRSGMFSWFKWDTSLPTSLRTSRNDVMNGRGAGVSPLTVAAPPREAPPPQAPKLQRARSWRQITRSGPAFETPVPAMYQTDMPASMAKIIMSRH